MDRKKGRVDDIVGSGGRMVGEEVGDLGGDFRGDSPRRRSKEDICVPNTRGKQLKRGQIFVCGVVEWKYDAIKSNMVCLG